MFSVKNEEEGMKKIPMSDIVESPQDNLIEQKGFSLLQFYHYNRKGGMIIIFVQLEYHNFMTVSNANNLTDYGTSRLFKRHQS